MRTANAVSLKKYLRNRLGEEEEVKAEQMKAVSSHIPGASKNYDPWEDLFREFYHNNQFDLKNKKITYISPIVFSLENMTLLDLSQN